MAKAGVMRFNLSIRPTEHHISIGTRMSHKEWDELARLV
jgi:hypothetical protein